jgi:hypothetical protein
MSTLSINTAFGAEPAPKRWDAGIGRAVATLELSELRAYDCALAILGAYKLTGHFATELEIVLRDLGIIDKVTYEIEPKSPLSDLRRVTFRPTATVHPDKFQEIMGLVNKRIGYDATLPWWVRLFR